MRQWVRTDNGVGGASTRTRLKSPLSSPIIGPSGISSSSGLIALSNTPSSSSGSGGAFLDVQSDDLTPFPSEWYHAAALYPFQTQTPVTQQLQHLHLEAQQQYQQMSQHEPFQQQLTAASAVSSNSNSSSSHCPICLRVSAQAPIRQACGHALCLQCTQQAISMLGSCPLCRTQFIFGGNNNSSSNNGRSLSGARVEVIEPGFTSNDMSFGQARIQVQQQQFDDAYLAQHEAAFQSHQSHQHQTVTSPVPFEARDLHSDSDITLQLDGLSDFGDMIDLPDLVASDSELSRHSLVTATATAVGPAAGLVAVRKATRAPRKKATATEPSKRDNGGAKTSSGTTAPAAAIGKKRKRKAPELVDESLAWAQVDVEGEIPAQRYDCGFAVFESNLIVVGGIVGNHRLNDLYILETDHSPARWKKPLTTGTPPPTGSLLQTFVIGETLYVIGGTNDGKFLNELHAMNLKSGEWKWERLTIAGQPPSMRYWYSISVLDGVAILYGGYGHPKRLGDTFALRFDTEVPTWTELQPSGDLPGPSSTHSVCVHEGKMLIFGGYDGKSRRSQLHALSIVSKTAETLESVWEQVTTLGRGPAPRYTHSSASIGSTMLVYGGNSGCLKGDLHLLEFGGVELPTWKLVKCEHAPPPREWHRAVVLDGAMFVFGGHTAEGNENKLFKLMTKAAP